MSLRIALMVVAVAFAIAACEGGRRAAAYDVATGGRPQRGAAIIRAVGCGSCHTVPGIREADGVVAPPLNFFSRRSFIAGELPNTPENLIRWLRDPPSVEPRTAMPSLGLSEQDARDIAAYLYTLT